MLENKTGKEDRGNWEGAGLQRSGRIRKVTCG